MQLDGQVSFAKQVKPLFRELDRTSMLKAFDLWKYDDVVTHHDAILKVLAAGSMPCDGAWEPEQLALLRRWIETGMLP